MKQVLKLNTNSLLGIPRVQIKSFSIQYSWFEMNKFLREYSGRIIDIQFIKDSVYILYQEVD